MDTTPKLPMTHIEMLNKDSYSHNAEKPLDRSNGISPKVFSDTQRLTTPLHNDYRTIMDNAFVGLYVIKDYQFRYVNAWLSRMLGYDTSAQLIGKSLWATIHPEDRIRLKFELHLKEKHTDAQRFHVRFLKRDGSVLWLSMKGKTITYLGKPAHVGHLAELVSAKDIERSLRESQQKFGAIINDISDAVTELDLKGNIQFVNKAAIELFDTSLKNIIGRNFRSYVDESTAQTVFKKYNEIYRSGISGKCVVYEVTRYDKQRRLVEDSIYLIRNEDDIITGFRVVSRDITDRINAEKELAENRTRLEAVFSSVKDAIITVNPDLCVTAVNSATKKICGISSKDILDKPFPQHSQQCSRACYSVLQQTVEQKTVLQRDHIECKSKLRQHQTVSISSSPLLNPHGTFLGAVLVIRDITRLKNLERELRGKHHFQNIIGKSKQMQDIYTLLEELASLDTTILVTGESGTGKELIAKALHNSGCRSDKPFITVNCSALAENLLESELFGHVKGAFTGAFNDKQGRFQAADGGTIVLDEIGDISPTIQLKLLRVLQNKEFERVGENISRKVDIRIIACANRNIKEKVKNNTFREDLYYRLKVVEIPLPPLRERIKDVPLLTDHFCELFNKKYGKNISGLSNAVLRQFMDYSWPGNVRELEHAMERAFILCRSTIIEMKHLPPEIRNSEKSPLKPLVKHFPPNQSQDAQDVLTALNKTGGRKNEAAQLLGISRQTLYRKIRKYEIQVSGFVSTHDKKR